MITHSEVWRAIDLLVGQNGLSISELARQAGLDRTAFATSKRLRDVRSRWPSTESLSRILQMTDSNMLQFLALLHSHAGQGAVLPADRVVVKNREVRLASINRAHGDLVISRRDVEWISRIVWVSQ